MNVNKKLNNKNDQFIANEKLNNIIEAGKLKAEALKKILVGIEKNQQRGNEKINKEEV